MLAAMEGDSDCVRLLMDCGTPSIDKDAKDDVGRTALICGGRSVVTRTVCGC
jgi:hypothetical protein